MKLAEKLSEICSKVVTACPDNTCRTCGVIGVPSKALNNTVVCFDDFEGDSGTRGTTSSRVGEAQMIDCLKCPKCGHSWVPKKEQVTANEQQKLELERILVKLKQAAQLGFGSIHITMNSSDIVPFKTSFIEKGFQVITSPYRDEFFMDVVIVWNVDKPLLDD